MKSDGMRLKAEVLREWSGVERVKNKEQNKR